MYTSTTFVIVSILSFQTCSTMAVRETGWPSWRIKLGKSKRFCDVIVRAGIEPTDALLNHAGARHDNHGQIRPFGANSAQDVQPAGSRQIEIQDHEIVRLVGSQLLRLRSTGNHLYRELLLLQPLVQKFRQRRVIFSDKNAHRLTQTA